MANFKKIAQESTVLCKLQSGRTKLESKEVQNQTLTVIGFDFAPKFDKQGGPIINEQTGEPDTYAVIILEELPGRFYSCGTVFTKVCKAWAAEYGGDAEAASADLEVEGGVQVKFTMGQTRGGNNLMNVEIV